MVYLIYVIPVVDKAKRCGSTSTPGAGIGRRLVRQGELEPDAELSVTAGTLGPTPDRAADLIWRRSATGA